MFLKATIAYFVVVFAAGFLLGTIRVLAVAPLLGEMAAVALELPLMLLVAWVVAGLIYRAWPVGRAARRLASGVAAFAMLIAAEMALARTLAGQDLGGFLAATASGPGLLGLAGQGAFALIPAFRRL
jgi:hypothetical protein